MYLPTAVLGRNRVADNEGIEDRPAVRQGRPSAMGQEDFPPGGTERANADPDTRPLPDGSRTGMPGPGPWAGARLRLWSRHAYQRGADRHRWGADRFVAAAAGGGDGAAATARGGPAAGPGHQHHLPAAVLDR